MSTKSGKGSIANAKSDMAIEAAWGEVTGERNRTFLREVLDSDDGLWTQEQMMQTLLVVGREPQYTFEIGKRLSDQERRATFRKRMDWLDRVEEFARERWDLAPLELSNFIVAYCIWVECLNRELNGYD